MSDLVFLRAADLLWMAIATCGALLWFWKRPRRALAATTVRYLRSPRLKTAPLRFVPPLLVVAALVATQAALLEPVLTSADVEVEAVGVDLVLVLDLSSSMQEIMGLERPSASTAHLRYGRRPGSVGRRPVGRTRLEVTKEALKQVVRGRQGDRVGLVVFSDNAYIVSPLTYDYGYLLRYIDMVDDKILRDEGMTAIGEGLALAHYLLRRQRATERRSQAIVVFTDGENNLGRDPLQTMEGIVGDQVSVHLVGVDMELEIKARPQVQQLVSAVLSRGGSHFDADTEEQLREASAEIDALEQGALVQVLAEQNQPVYGRFAAVALIALALAAAAAAVPRWVDLT